MVRIFILVLGIVGSSLALAEPVLIHNVTLIDGRGGPPIDGQSVLVRCCRLPGFRYL